MCDPVNLNIRDRQKPLEIDAEGTAISSYKCRLFMERREASRDTGNSSTVHWFNARVMYMYIYSRLFFFWLGNSIFLKPEV